MKISIKKQFSLVVSVLVAITAVLISIFLFVYIKDAVDEKIQLSVNNTLEKCADELENRIDNISKLNEGLCTDKRLFEIASYETDDFFERKDTNAEFSDEYTKLTQLLMNNVYDRYASALYIYENYPISDEYIAKDVFDFIASNIFKGFYKIDKDNALNNLDFQELTLIPLENKSTGLIFAQEIVDKVTYSYEPLGVNIIQVDIQSHFKKYKEIDMITDINFFVTDSKGNLIYCDGNNDTEKILAISKEIKTFETGKLNYTNKNKNLIGVYPIGLGLRLCTYIDADFMSFEVKNIALRISLIILFFLVLLIYAVHILFGKMTNQISELSQLMLNYDENIDANQIVLKEHKVIEIQSLYESFDKMSKKIKLFVEEAHFQGVKEKEMEIKLLQSQIKPHFLYNALDSISWLAIRNNQHDIVDIVSALSDNFRYSIKDTDKLISVCDEFDFIIDFLCLQELIRKNHIKTRIEIDDEVKKLFIPKFLIQPIVENAVIHGMSEDKDNINIKLSACVESEKLILNISDNGIGTDADKLNRYLNGDTDVFASEKIGIKNVNERIKLKFGNEFGLSYKNEDEFFVAQITIPVIKSAS